MSHAVPIEALTADSARRAKKVKPAGVAAPTGLVGSPAKSNLRKATRIPARSNLSLDKLRRVAAGTRLGSRQTHELVVADCGGIVQGPVDLPSGARAKRHVRTEAGTAPAASDLATKKGGAGWPA